MSDSASVPESDETRTPPGDGLPEHLPPVEPPSAGFIVQLFVVPAIIVAAVIGVYLLFGRMAAGQADWRQMVSDIKSDNPNVRWRAALNLAEALDAEAGRKGDEQKLSSIPEIATALNDLTIEQLKTNGNDDEHRQQLQYLLKAIGRMDAIDQTWPALRDALDPRQDVETRKQALQSIAMIAGREREAGHVLDHAGVVDAVVDASTSPDEVLRQHAAFTLGLMPGAASDGRLGVLLEDSDKMTRLNAAIGFAREKSPRGVPVFVQALTEMEEWAKSPTTGPNAAERGFEQQVMLKNILHAVTMLGPTLGAGERAEFIGLFQKLEASLQDSALRLQVKEARLELEKA
jgi:hypothetical protein